MSEMECLDKDTAGQNPLTVKSIPLLSSEPSNNEINGDQNEQKNFKEDGTELANDSATEVVPQKIFEPISNPDGKDENSSIAGNQEVAVCDQMQGDNGIAEDLVGVVNVEPGSVANVLENGGFEKPKEKVEMSSSLPTVPVEGNVEVVNLEELPDNTMEILADLRKNNDIVNKPVVGILESTTVITDQTLNVDYTASANERSPTEDCCEEDSSNNSDLSNNQELEDASESIDVSIVPSSENAHPLQTHTHRSIVFHYL